MAPRAKGAQRESRPRGVDASSRSHQTLIGQGDVGKFGGAEIGTTMPNHPSSVLSDCEEPVEVPGEKPPEGPREGFPQPQRLLGRDTPNLTQELPSSIWMRTVNLQHAPGCGATIRRVATAVKKLDLEIGEIVEASGRRYEVVPDRQGGLTLEPPITPMAELDKQWGTKPASAEDFERVACDFPTDDEG